MPKAEDVSIGRMSFSAHPWPKPPTAYPDIVFFPLTIPLSSSVCFPVKLA